MHIILKILALWFKPLKQTEAWELRWQGTLYRLCAQGHTFISGWPWSLHRANGTVFTVHQIEGCALQWMAISCDIWCQTSWICSLTSTSTSCTSTSGIMHMKILNLSCADIHCTAPSAAKTDPQIASFTMVTGAKWYYHVKNISSHFPLRETCEVCLMFCEREGRRLGNLTELLQKSVHPWGISGRPCERLPSHTHTPAPHRSSCIPVSTPSNENPPFHPSSTLCLQITVLVVGMEWRLRSSERLAHDHAFGRSLRGMLYKSAE